MLKHGSLFSGIGGFDLAAQKVGWYNVFNCEIDNNCRKVLKKNFKDVLQYSDITKVDFTVWRNGIDIISGGVPCQPFSKVGLMKGKDDERYLWDEYIRTLRECRPKWFVAENVSGLLTTNSGSEYHEIITQMEDTGYETLTLSLPATSVGTQHIRERVWIIGRDKMGCDTDPKTQRLGEIRNTSEAEGAQRSLELFGEPFRLHWYETISRFHGKFDGVPGRMDGFRNRALGNAIVPQVAFVIFSIINIIESTYKKQNDGIN